MYKLTRQITCVFRVAFLNFSVFILLFPSMSIISVAEVAENEFVIEEIIVTARKREENLMDTPVSITAFSAEDLSRRQIESINQLSESTPNVVFQKHSGSSASSNSAVVYIRGIGQEDFIPTVEPGVGIYLDDIYVSQSVGAVLDVADIESIQILRGPQGTLFGRNTIGGAILVNTKKPHDEFAGDVEFTAGAYKLMQGKASLNLPLTENLFARASFLGRHKDGYVNFPLIAGDDGGGSDDTQAGRLALRWLANDDLTIDASLEYTHAESDGRPSVLGTTIQEIPGNDVFLHNNVIAPITGAPQYTNVFHRPIDERTSLVTQTTRSQIDVWGASLTLDWDIAGLNLKSISSYRELQSEDRRDRDHSPVFLSVVGDDINQQQFSQELQLSGKAFNERLQWLLGFYYAETEVENINDPVVFPAFGIVSGSVVDNYSLAVFSQGTYALSEQLSLTVGLRYTKEDKESIVDDSIQYVNSLFNPAVPGGYLVFPPRTVLVQPKGTFENKETEIDPYVSLAYQWNEGFMTYFSYSEGFKGGGFVQRVQPGQVVTSFAPEFASVYELGFKWEGLDSRLRLTGSGYFTDYTDLQITVQRVIAPVKENAGDAEIYGFELEATALLTPQFQVSGGLGYTHAEYTRIDPLATITRDHKLAFTPEWQMNASAAYTFPVPVLSGSFIARVDWSWTDDMALDAANNPESFQDSYHLLNASLTYEHESEKWEIAFQGRNLTDELYLSGVNSSIASSGFLDVSISPPAEWNLRFKYRF